MDNLTKDTTHSVLVGEVVSRAQRARRAIRPVLDAKTKEAITDETASPFAPVDVEWTYNGKIYLAFFRAQDVDDALYQRMQINEQRALVRAGLAKVMREVEVEITDAKTGKTTTEKQNQQRPFAEIASILNDEEIKLFLEINSGESLREEKVLVFAGHVENWNVPDENGEIAPFTLEAFQTNRGIYDAALDAFQAAFLATRAPATAATANTAPLSTTGDTPSLPPATDNQTSV